MKRAGEMPRYQQIAADIAGKIITQEYTLGDRLFSRSGLATHYGVSPETARRAIALLADVGVVEVVKGSGCTVSSVDKARHFRDQFYSLETVGDLRKQLQEKMERQKAGLTDIEDTLSKLSDYATHYQHTNPLTPLKLKITEDCAYLGETIGSIHLWQHTGATVVALNRKGVLHVSPGPYAILREGDELFVVGSSDAWNRLRHYLRGTSR